MTDWVKITRTFDAPIEIVWAMWTDAIQFQKWYGPKGFSVPVAEMDVTVGGTRKINMAMQMPDRTMSMWFTGSYKEVSAPHRLVYTESLCDPDGNVIFPHAVGMPEGTPEVTEVIVELSQEGGKTVMTMTHLGVPAGSQGEGGWTQAFDKLGVVLDVV
ncbi:MAG: SRPBCC domain-containing protein [Yoonia sp.]|uniref:SRPBCC family protein n=1 Tax=Yoonia sp. TaxID=2212373 RepID=UPI00273FF5CC|nr:SRPBCC domain-containing protein [Yoonia sp.]MDP5087022.1 SRPBCC domain-containing protein [Yoonia sp.]